MPTRGLLAMLSTLSPRRARPSGVSHFDCVATLSNACRLDAGASVPRCVAANISGFATLPSWCSPLWAPFSNHLALAPACMVDGLKTPLRLLPCQDADAWRLH